MYKIIDGEYYLPCLNVDDGYKKLEVGLKVVDVTIDFIENYIGIVKECDDVHNVLVEVISSNEKLSNELDLEYNIGSINLYCLVEDCEEGYYDENLKAL